MDYRVLFSCLKPGFFESEWIQNMDERIVWAAPAAWAPFPNIVKEASVLKW